MIHRLLDKAIQRSPNLDRYYVCPNPRPKTLVAVGRLPAVCHVGDLFFDTAESVLYTYTGSSWSAVAPLWRAEYIDPSEDE